MPSRRGTPKPPPSLGANAPTAIAQNDMLGPFAQSGASGMWSSSPSQPQRDTSFVDPTDLDLSHGHGHGSYNFEGETSRVPQVTDVTPYAAGASNPAAGYFDGASAGAEHFYDVAGQPHNGSVESFIVDQFSKTRDFRSVFDSVVQDYGKATGDEVFMRACFSIAHDSKMWTPAEENALLDVVKHIDGKFWPMVRVEMGLRDCSDWSERELMERYEVVKMRNYHGTSPRK